jgi:hypothetical protein
MPELIILTKPHWTTSLTPNQIDLSDTNLFAYLTKKDIGFVCDVKEDSFFATPNNRKGRGWNGNKSWLVKIPGTIEEYKNKMKFKTITINLTLKQKDIQIIDETIDVNSILADSTQEVWICNFPGAVENSQIRYIYTFIDKSKLKTKKETYEKTLKINGEKSIK